LKIECFIVQASRFFFSFEGVSDSRKSELHRAIAFDGQNYIACTTLTTCHTIVVL